MLRKIKYLFLTLNLFLISTAHAYTPKLLLLGEYKNGKYFIDSNSIKEVQGGLKQAVIYEKFSQPVRIDRNQPYQSDIKYYVFDCNQKTIAAYKGQYFRGLTSNSELIGAFNHAVIRNGDTGETLYSYDNLEFIKIMDLKIMGAGSFDITPYYSEAFNVACKAI